ncbi:hypothetical protein PMI13_01453 [Chryseobacterium populi]|uniref:Tetratricopeptide repeat protein n=2 Tax=Chryseobacterium populi TaxID=1144316 RepID=J3CL19_9FLAO|nr:hypothetical protein PMI13_01453 [Chryseobacterium populi]
MNARVLELLKNPKNIQSEDLSLLKEEINSFPYIQNIRALHLYGIHLFDKENYQKELSITAAYTTDKKILYQLINGKIQQIPKPEFRNEKPAEGIERVTKYVYQTQSFPLKREDKQENGVENKIVFSYPLPTSAPETQPVYVNGERNRILFEDEENFLDEENAEKIDIESTLESGTLVTQKTEVKEPVKEEENNQAETTSNVEKDNVADGSGFTPEIIVNKEGNSSKEEKEEIKASENVGFHETEAFVPEVSVQSLDPVEEKKEVEEVAEDVKTDENQAAAEFTPEKILDENEVSPIEESDLADDGAELSFHGMDSFMPDVKIQSGNTEEQAQPKVQPNLNKHEDEMRRLIEEVEKKMKAAKEKSVEKTEEEPEIVSHDISFAETQHFHTALADEKIEEENPEIDIKEEEIKQPELPEAEIPNEAKPEEPVAEVKSSWKPMSFESYVPDSLINTPAETPPLKSEVVQQETLKEEVLPEVEKMAAEVQPEAIETVDEELVTDNQEPDVTDKKNHGEAPILNVSFFGSDISQWNLKENKTEEKSAEEKIEESEASAETTAATHPADSNVPGFINTWQSWLKIDRTEENGKAKPENKTKVIDSFIENNPKISQLKEESSFVVKEKTDDISHLMTETLANLYFEQKLYTKAIKAFEILINKHPEKKDYFEQKIQEIKEFRSKN